MPDSMTLERISEARGAPVYAADGDKIGDVEEIFYDTRSNQPEWIGIGTGFFGTKRVLVPLAGAQLRDDGLYVAYPKDQVKDSPDIDSDEISEQTEQELYSYYQLSAGAPGESSRKARGKDKQEMTRSEEELRVGTQTVETGRARLRKYVETEPAEMDVELKRETARVTREEIDEPVSDAEIGEEEVDVELRAERPVVQKQAVAKERVGLETDVETKKERVRDEVRKERVEVEDDS